MVSADADGFDLRRDVGITPYGIGSPCRARCLHRALFESRGAHRFETPHSTLHLPHSLVISDQLSRSASFFPVSFAQIHSFFTIAVDFPALTGYTLEH